MFHFSDSLVASTDLIQKQLFLCNITTPHSHVGTVLTLCITIFSSKFLFLKLRRFLLITNLKPKIKFKLADPTVIRDPKNLVTSESGGLFKLRPPYWIRHFEFRMFDFELVINDSKNL